MLYAHGPLLVNLVGHVAGALLFGTFLILVLRERRDLGFRRSWLSVSSASLAFGWNAELLLILARPDAPS